MISARSPGKERFWLPAGRLQKVETDVVDIRSQMNLKPIQFLRGSYIYFLIPRTGRDVLDRCQKKKPWKR